MANFSNSFIEVETASTKPEANDSTQKINNLARQTETKGDENVSPNAKPPPIPIKGKNKTPINHDTKKNRQPPEHGLLVETVSTKSKANNSTQKINNLAQQAQIESDENVSPNAKPPPVPINEKNKTSNSDTKKNRQPPEHGLRVKNSSQKLFKSRYFIPETEAAQAAEQSSAIIDNDCYEHSENRDSSIKDFKAGAKILNIIAVPKCQDVWKERQPSEHDFLVKNSIQNLIKSPNFIPETEAALAADQSSAVIDNDRYEHSENQDSAIKDFNVGEKILNTIAVPNCEDLWERTELKDEKFGVTDSSLKTNNLQERMNNFNFGNFDAMPLSESSDMTNFGDLNISIERQKVERLSLPDMKCGGICITNTASDNIELSTHIPETVRVDYQPFQLLSNQNLMSGGMVVFEELSRHLYLPNIYAEEPPIIVPYVPNDLESAKITPITEKDEPQTTFMKEKDQQVVYCNSFSGGGRGEDCNGGKICLPYLFSETFTEDYEVFRSYAHRSSLSGGRLLHHQDCDHVTFSDIVSRCSDT